MDSYKTTHVNYFGPKKIKRHRLRPRQHTHIGLCTLSDFVKILNLTICRTNQQSEL